MRQLKNRPQYLPRIAVIIFVAVFGSLSTQAADCTGFLKAFNSYDEFTNGKLEMRHSIFDLTDWSEHSAFEGVLGTDQVPEKSKFILEYRKTKKAKPTRKEAGFEAWTVDLKYKHAKLDPESVLKEKTSGTYTVRVTHESKTLCEQTLDVTGGD